jgi:tape measure domain-containing protein
MVGGEIKVVMTLDDGDFSVKTIKNGNIINEMKRSLDQTATSTKNLENHFTGLGKTFQSTVFTLSLVRFALTDIHDIFLALPSAILKSAGEMERMTKLMEGMSKATDDYSRKAEAASSVKYIFNLAQNAPFEVKALTDAFVKMKSGGIDPLAIGMQALTDSVAKFGGTSDTLHRASIAIQQMAGKGVISMEELRQQLGEAVPNAINLMAEGAGMSTAKFAKLVSTGVVEATGALNNMFAAMIVENYGAASSMMDTWTGMLALLKTKFELFKINIAGDEKTDFFAEAKASLKELIEAFDGMTSKSLAYDMGQALASIVRALREVINFTREWWDSIKLAGEAFLVYFAVDKIMVFTEAFRKFTMDRIALYKKEIADQESAKTDKLRLIMAEIAAEEGAFVRNQAIIAKEADAQAAAAAKEAAASATKLEKQRAALAKELADRVAHYQELNTIQQQFLAQQMAAELQAEAQLRRKKAGSAAAAAAANAEAMRIANNSAILATTVNSTKAEIEALKAKETALLAAIAATRNHTVANTADAAVSALTAEHFKKTTILLDQKAAASTAAALSVGMLTRAMTAANLVFQAFGGWVGVAIAALTYLGQKLYDFLKSWEKAEEVSKKIRKGIAASTDEETLKPKVAALDTRIARDEKFFAKTARPQDVPEGTDPATKRIFQQAQKEYDDRKKQYEADIALRKKYVDDISESKRLLQKEDDDSDARAYRARTVDAIKASVQEQNAQLDALRKQKQDIEDELKGRGATGDQVEKATKDLKDKISAKTKESILIQSNMLKAEQDRLNALLKTAADGEKGKISAMLEEITNERTGLASQWNNYKEAAKDFGTLKVAKKDKNETAEDPLIRAIQDIAGQVQSAKLKLQSTIQEVRGFDQMKNEAFASVLGDMASGRFDSSAGKDGDGTVRRNYMGGLQERKKYVEEFAAYLKSGGTDIDTFARSLKGLSDTERERLVMLASQKAFIADLTQNQKALTDAQQRAVQSQTDLTVAQDRFNNQGLSTTDTAFRNMIKHFDALGARLKSASADFEEFRKKRAEALGNVAIASSLNFASDEMEKMRTAQAEYIKATATVSQYKEYAHREELRRINLEADTQLDRLEELAAKEQEGTKEKIRLENAILSVQATRSDAQDRAQVQYTIATMTELQKLKRVWQDTTEQMNRVTAQWGQNIIDNIAQATTGGTADFKQMARNMAMDMYKISLQKTLAVPITGALDGISSMMGGLMGGGGATTGEKGTLTNPMITKDVGAAGEDIKTKSKEMFEEVKEKLSTVWDDLKSGLQGMWDSLGEFGTSMLEGLGEGLSGMLDSVMGMFSGGGGGGGDYTSLIASFFADGGIMTGSGSLDLVKYAGGGVATRPQLAMFGEGSMPEAYVPLPDGRSIPVSFTGNTNTTNSGGNVVSISINIAQDGSSSSKDAGSGEAEWYDLANRVKGVVMEQLVTQQRPGGVLYK